MRQHVPCERAIWLQLFAILMVLFSPFVVPQNTLTGPPNSSQLKPNEVPNAFSYPPESLQTSIKVKRISTSDRPKAAFVLLLKDSLGSSLNAIASLEWAFNNNFKYPYIIFHEGLPIELQNEITNLTQAEVTFIFVDIMQLPTWLSEQDIPAKVPGFTKDNRGYRAMCRFFSGVIFQHQAIKDLEYLWRLDHDSLYLCPIQYDVFKYMKRNNVAYGWNLLFYEGPEISGETLWEVTRKFMRENGIPMASMEPLLSWWGTYSRCQFWNNFEVMNVKRFVEKNGYMKYFDYLDKLGGFYFFRWGDALVRTLGAHMFLAPHEIHRFDDIGYHHQNICVNHCGAESPLRLKQPSLLRRRLASSGSTIDTSKKTKVLDEDDEDEFGFSIPFECMEEPEYGICEHCNWLEVKTRGFNPWLVVIPSLIFGLVWIVRKFFSRKQASSVWWSRIV